MSSQSIYPDTFALKHYISEHKPRLRPIQQQANGIWTPDAGFDVADSPIKDHSPLRTTAAWLLEYCQIMEGDPKIITGYFGTTTPKQVAAYLHRDSVVRIPLTFAEAELAQNPSTIVFPDWLQDELYLPVAFHTPVAELDKILRVQGTQVAEGTPTVIPPRQIHAECPVPPGTAKFSLFASF